MKKIIEIRDSIHELIMSNFYTRLIDWYRVTEIEENNIYEVRLYKNFITTEGIGMKQFEEDIKEIVKRLEDRTLMKIDKEYFINVIKEVNVTDDDVLEIVLISERLRRREDKWKELLERLKCQVKFLWTV